jgi:diacylglycerol kinase family enzyme
LSPALCWAREELDALLASGRRDEVRCVIAAGGDGTLLEVVNRAPGVPITVLPLGNENLVARYCGMKRSGASVAAAVAAGYVHALDLARADARVFCLMASVGIDADVVHRVHRRRRGHINRLTYVVPLIQALTAYGFPMVEAEIEDTGERLRGATVFLFNLPEYALGLPIAIEAKADDGLLDLCVFDEPGVMALVRYLTAIATSRHRELPDFRHRKVRRVCLTAQGEAPIQTDGDPAGRLPITIEVASGALPLVVPCERA